MLKEIIMVTTVSVGNSHVSYVNKYSAETSLSHHNYVFSSLSLGQRWGRGIGS